MQGIRMGQVQEGQRVVVMGQGIIGRLATLLARALGASEVVCVTRATEKLRKLHEQQGIATDEICTSDTMKNLRADVVIDATGNPEAIHTAMVAAREGGKIVLLGSNRGNTISFDVNGLPMAKSLTIVGAHIRNQHLMPPDIGLDYHGEAHFIQELLNEKRLSLKDIITARVPCTGLTNFYLNNLSIDRDSCGIIIDWSDSTKLLHANQYPLEYPQIKLTEGIKPLKMALIGCGDIGVKDADTISKCGGF
jgi:threonine dehydrogenase-like Zn-dependent dehydrogenase